MSTKIKNTCNSINSEMLASQPTLSYQKFKLMCLKYKVRLIKLFKSEKLNRIFRKPMKG